MELDGLSWAFGSFLLATGFDYASGILEPFSSLSNVQSMYFPL